MEKKQIEAITKIVYGDTFGRYNREEFLEFLHPLRVRLSKNNIPESVFQGKRCLDAGCGGGRASVLMARAGAAEVVSYDLSEENIKTTERNAALFGLKNIRTHCGSLLEIPFEDESFDVVWSNGVLHHTAEPDRALSEVLRMLKVNGNLWLYLYGSGGIYWYMVNFLREWLGEIGIHETIAFLSSIETPVGRVAEFIDDWYVPMLKRYKNLDVTNRLKELGVEQFQYLKGGMTYDTSERRGAAEENAWMGEGDLRYWGTKTKRPTGKSDFVLPDVNGIGSAFNDSKEVQSFGAEFESLAATVSAYETAFPSLGRTPRITIAAQMQTWLRDQMSKPEPFKGEEFRAWIHSKKTALGRYL